ncbi:MAG TPA: hypothetical protein VHW46_03290 [Terracidiphilus sp.]|jgi:hypothetical protein|nr:hypothetical protein [Terracidiphilus sp.]
MKTQALVLLGTLTALLATTPSRALQSAGGQSLLPAGDAISLAIDPSAGNSPDDNAYADGVRAINTGKWQDAITIFTKVAAQGSSHTEGALYWKAYAENKQGQSSTALDTCGSLRQAHPGSSWIEECGALEIEIHARDGKPVPPKSEQNDDLKLLALASLMQHDEKRALTQIDQILNSDASEKLKQGALFIMGEHHSDTVYSQIARLSFVDGDVRIERGQDDPHRKEVTWEAAASGVPLESGYSVVTGAGRAEIELEDASTLYLAPNSVLTINDLSTTAGVPFTDMALLTGTVTLHVRPYVAGEIFLLRTPTDNLLTKYPMTSNLRISSYLDGDAIAGLDKAMLSMGVSGTSQLSMPIGQTLYFKSGRRILDAGPTHPEDFNGWDAWVSSRYTTRTEALAEMTKQAGLSAPLPGMADMQGKGRFFECQPYGTCWEPGAEATASNDKPVETASAREQPAIGEHAIAQAATSQTTSTGRNIHFVGPAVASGPPTSPYSEMDAFSACIPDEMRFMRGQGFVPASAQFHTQPWAWTVCHSGSWIYQGNHYVWVTGHRHHRPCVDWVKYGHTVAFVPIHPHDVKGHLPVNRIAPVFVVNTKNARSLELSTLENVHSVELLKEPPKEFRTVAMVPLPRAADPHMEGHQLRDTLAARNAGPRPAGIPITFDHRSQNFVMPNHAMEGNRPSTGFMPVTNHGGNLQSHAGSMNGGNAGSAFGGSSYHGGFSGGASHVSGSSGGSMASHSSGGGGGNISSGSVSSSSASSSASSSGGAHK